MTNAHEGDFDSILDDENLDDATDELDALEELAGAEKVDDDDSDGEESKLKILIDTGKEQGYLTYDQLTAALPESIEETDEFESIVLMFEEMGVSIYSHTTHTYCVNKYSLRTSDSFSFNASFFLIIKCSCIIFKVLNN